MLKRLKAPQPGQAETTSQATQSLNDQDQAYKKRRKDAEEARAKAEKEAEQARIQRENCDKARKNLSTLQNTPRAYTTNAPASVPTWTKQRGQYCTGQ